MNLKISKLSPPRLVPIGSNEAESCAIEVLSILFGLTTHHLNGLIHKRRVALGFRGYLSRFKHVGRYNIHEIDWREIVGLLKEYKPYLRARFPSDRISIEKFAKQTEDNAHVYVVYIHNHVLILKNGLVYDNHHNGSDVHWYFFRNSCVKEYVVLR